MPDISKITLPSGTTYDIKDATAREMISGGVSFIIAWDGVSVPVPANIPNGVNVTYNGTTYTGTLDADDATSGAFYLVKSSTTTSGSPSDSYDEYVPVGSAGSKTWEKIGDTQVDLSDVVTEVTLSKQTDTVIGSDSTFSVTQPSVSLSTGASSGTGVVSLVTGITSVSASGDNVTALTGLGTASKDEVLGSSTTFGWSGSVTVTEAASTDPYDISVPGANIVASDWDYGKISINGSTVSASGDNVTAMTGLGTPSTKSAIGSNSTFTVTQPTVSLSSNSSTGTGRVQVATGTGSSSSTNTDWLKGISVENEILTIGASTLSTTYLGGSASGANVAWNNKDSVTAVTGYSSPTTDTVLGTGSTMSVDSSNISVSPGTITDYQFAVPSSWMASGHTYYKFGASGSVNVGTNDKVNAVTGYSSPTTDTVLGTGSTITVTPTTTNVKATASGGNVAWNNKDTVTALTNSTTITVTKGNNPVTD